ncbi:unnamed protein product [Brugia timori]|uniref:G_PROTEIN_RECEP_F1_2 domain-containing protein n=1 Tax=Brugia timori TaxID=42155 RepID=A0A0R3QU12_9BILA|nr:unnamed protein product [Brugia timori]
MDLLTVSNLQPVIMPVPHSLLTLTPHSTCSIQAVVFLGCHALFVAFLFAYLNVTFAALRSYVTVLVARKEYLRK